MIGFLRRAIYNLRHERDDPQVQLALGMMAVSAGTILLGVAMILNG